MEMHHKQFRGKAAPCPPSGGRPDSGDSSVQKVGGPNWGQPKLLGGNTKTFDYTSVCCFYGAFVALHKVQQCLFPSISRRDENLSQYAYDC